MHTLPTGHHGQIDALHMIGMRNPTVADTVVEPMSSHEELEPRRATDRLDSEGFFRSPTFELEVGQKTHRVATRLAALVFFHF